MSVAELFDYWVVDNIANSEDGAWVLAPIRPSQRKRLLAKLDIQGEAIRGLTLGQFGALVLRAAGLPVHAPLSRSEWQARWSKIGELATLGEDEKAASQSRQAAERLLRLVIYFYCSCGHAMALWLLLSDPGDLRLPKKLEKFLKDHAAEDASKLAALFVEDGWTDLGFLSIATRKLSQALSESGQNAVTGQALTLLAVEEQKAFDGLARALQPYSHDRPTANQTRRLDLVAAIGRVQEVVDAMAARNVLPQRGLVLETCDGLLGPMFRGMSEPGQSFALLCRSPPRVSDRILYIPGATRPYAQCWWALDPWALSAG